MENLLSNNQNAYSIKRFCESHDISIPTFFRLRKIGKGPKVIKLGRKVLISREAAAEWRKNMEK